MNSWDLGLRFRAINDPQDPWGTPQDPWGDLFKKV